MYVARGSKGTYQCSRHRLGREYAETGGVSRSDVISFDQDVSRERLEAHLEFGSRHFDYKMLVLCSGIVGRIGSTVFLDEIAVSSSCYSSTPGRGRLISRLFPFNCTKGSTTRLSSDRTIVFREGSSENTANCRRSMHAVRYRASAQNAPDCHSL